MRISQILIIFETKHPDISKITQPLKKNTIIEGLKAFRPLDIEISSDHLKYPKLKKSGNLTFFLNFVIQKSHMRKKIELNETIGRIPDQTE